jgi:hypothetical protein
MDKRLKFKIRLQGMEGSSVAALIAPFSVQEIFGAKARVPVKGTINGYPFRSSLMPMCGQHRMVVNREIREGAGVQAGDIVSVVMERDNTQRTVAVPPLLKKALTRSKTARERWNSLSFTHKKEMARFIEQARREETQVRRQAKVVDILKTGKKWLGH